MREGKGACLKWWWGVHVGAEMRELVPKLLSSVKMNLKLTRQWRARGWQAGLALSGLVQMSPFNSFHYNQRQNTRRKEGATVGAVGLTYLRPCWKSYGKQQTFIAAPSAMQCSRAVVAFSSSRGEAI